MIVGCSGHRPDKLGVRDISGYVKDNPLRTWIRAQTREHLRQLKPLYAISGMAIGYDQDFCDVCIELCIPFIAAIPFEGQERMWPVESQKEYRVLLAKAHEIVVVTPGPYERWKLQARNEWVVDHINVLIACFDGSPGGTANTVNYADRVQREKRRINPNEFHALCAAAGASP